MKRRWLIFIGAAVVFFVVLEFVFDFFPEEEKELRREFREAVVKTFPDQAAKVAQTFGLSRYEAISGTPGEITPVVPTVVLIHGLDDPGKVWMNLAPKLVDEGYIVWEMRYPNDQPIVDSARLFYQELISLRSAGIRRVAIVAHSMGGLVSRELLTGPQIGYSDKVRAGEVPRVVGLIMVGTPNHGSALSRLRIFTEIRDQWIHMTEGKGHWLRGILDGAGEAKIDLIPGSRFLHTLNERPHPQDVNMLVIAGIASPWDQNDIDRFVSATRTKANRAEQDMLGDLVRFFKSVTDGLGDGLVTVESTRLDGIAHQTVRGTHLSMIRNIEEGSRRVPPAVPVIAETLEQVFSDMDTGDGEIAEN